MTVRSDDDCDCVPSRPIVPPDASPAMMKFTRQIVAELDYTAEDCHGDSRSYAETPFHLFDFDGDRWFSGGDCGGRGDPSTGERITPDADDEHEGMDWWCRGGRPADWGRIGGVLGTVGTDQDPLRLRVAHEWATMATMDKKRPRGFTPHGARMRGFVTLSIEDAATIEDEATANDEAVTVVLRRAVRFYLSRKTESK